jgi:hypothetical protein
MLTKTLCFQMIALTLKRLRITMTLAFLLFSQGQIYVTGAMCRIPNIINKTHIM